MFNIRELEFILDAVQGEMVSMKYEERTITKRYKILNSLANKIQMRIEQSQPVEDSDLCYHCYSQLMKSDPGPGDCSITLTEIKLVKTTEGNHQAGPKDKIKA